MTAAENSQTSQTGQTGQTGSGGPCNWSAEPIPQVLPHFPRREEVVAELVKRWKPTPAHEHIDVADGLGRVLAQDVTAAFDSPVAQTSMLDGIGVHFADFADGLPDTSAWVRGKDYEICDTGDDVPDAFDTVLAVEQLLFQGIDGKTYPGMQGSAPFDEGFSVAVAPEEKGSHLRGPGGNFRQGDVIVPAGTRLTPEVLSAVVGCGQSSIDVYARPRVAFIPTGNELVPARTQPGRGQTVDSNTILVQSYLKELGAKTQLFDLQPDTHEAITAAVEKALAENDIVLVNAGSSKGSEDCCPRVLAEHAQDVIHHSQKAAPGRPAMSALTADGKVMCVIPGPPLSCDTAIHWLLMSLVAQWYGLTAVEHRVLARVDDEVPAAGFEFWRRCHISVADDGTYEAHLFDRRKRAGIQTLATANGIMRNLTDKDIHAGEMAEVLLLHDGFSF